MPDEPRVSNFTLAVPDRQLVMLVRDLMADYDRTYGGVAPLSWLLHKLGER